MPAAKMLFNVRAIILFSVPEWRVKRHERGRSLQ